MVCEHRLTILFFTLLRPIPEKEFVEAYVKAFYLTEPDMERWIREHKVNFHLSFAFYKPVQTWNIQKYYI